jgi:hypothetical protein
LSWSFKYLRTPRYFARYKRQLTWVVVALGILLRLVIWGQARSVYMDEVALLRNFVERDYAGLWQPLGYEQYAPPLFSVVVKASLTLFGTSEWAIRLVPVLVSCFMLGLYAKLALRWLPSWWAPLAVATVASSSLYLDFATVCKQYGTDGLVAVGILVLASHQVRQPTLRLWVAVGWAIGGALAIWTSMPAVFILAGVGLTFAWTYRRQLPGSPLGWLLLLASVWGLSFLVYFKLLLQADAQSAYLQQFHKDAFLAVPPQSAADWNRLGTQLGGLADKGFGKTGLAMALAGIGFLVGTVQLLRRPSARSWLLLVPLFTCLATSAWHYYSILPRLMIFWLPLALLVVLYGLSELAKQARWAYVVLPLLVFIVLCDQQRFKSLVVPFQADYVDLSGELAYVAARQQPDEWLFLYYNEQQLAHYYLHLSPKPFPLHNVVVQSFRSTPQNDVVQQDLLTLAAQGKRRIWLTYDLPDYWLRDWAAQHGTVTQFADFHRGYAFLWLANKTQ